MQIKDLDLIWDSCVWISLSSAVLGGDGDLARFLLCFVLASILRGFLSASVLLGFLSASVLRGFLSASILLDIFPSFGFPALLFQKAIFAEFHFDLFSKSLKRSMTP